MRDLNRRMSVLSFAVALTLQPLLMQAQTVVSGGAPAATVPVDTTQPATVQTAGTQPATVQTAATQPATSAASQISLDFRDAPVDTVLEHLSEIAGFVVIKDGPVTGRVTVLSKQPVTPKEAVALLDAVLRPNGYTAIQQGRILKIVALDKAKKSNIPVHVGSDPTLVDESDEVITQVIPVKNVDAVKLKTDLQPLIGTDADVTANAASNSLMITDTSANIHRIVEIVSSLDKHEALTNDIKVHPLKYADATAAAKLIMDIFAPQQSQNNNLPPALQFMQRFRGFGGGGAGGPGGGLGGPGGGAGAASDQDKGNTGHVQASADQRTNTVVVTGPPDTLAVIDDVLTKLDSDPSAQQTFFIYKVKNGQAVDMANTLNGLFSGNTNVSSSSQNNRSQYSSNGNRVSGSNNSSIGRSGSGSSSFGGGGGGAFGSGGGSSLAQGGNQNRNANNGGNNNNNNQNRQGGNSAGGGSSGISDLIGQVFVVADADTNSLLIAANTKYEQRVRDVIKELDRPVPQVLIKVLIAEVTHDNSLDFGTDFSVLNIRPSGKGQEFQSTLGAAAAAASSAHPGGLVLSMMESHVTATLQALAQQNKLDVLSRPYILTSDNQEADITVGSEVPFITESRLDTNNNTINTIQYQDIGIILDVTPHINPDGLVIMQVSPQISSLTGQTVPIQAGVNAPVFELRSASAYVAVKDGQTIVIGGLMQDQKTQSASKIPFLGDLPYLGPLFSYNSTDKSKTELLIFLTPHVATEPDDLKAMTEDESKGLKLTPGAVQPGTFEEQMRGMQLGGKTPTTNPVIVAPAPEQSNKPEGLGEPNLPGTSGK